MLHTLLKNEPLKSEMLIPIKSSLEHMYCHHDGWKLYNKYNWTNKCFDFLLQKESQTGVERVIVSVNLDNQVTRQHYDNLQKLSKRLHHGGKSPVKKILIFDNPVAFEAAPADVELMSVNELLNVRLRATEPKLVA